MAAAHHPGISQRGKPKPACERCDNPVPCRLRGHQGGGNQESAAADPGHGAGLPDQANQLAQARRLDGGAREYLGFAEHAVNECDRNRGQPGTLQQEVAHRRASIHDCMVLGQAPALVNTLVYGRVPSRRKMTDQLSAKDWLDQGLKTLAGRGFTALKAEPLAKALGVSRGSFYWHFADIGAFHAAILKHWREVAAEQIIANLEAASDHDDPVALLLRQAFGGKLSLEKAVRTWATVDPAARAAVQAIDRRRLGYVESLMTQSGLSAGVARARAQILYWAFLGFALSDQRLPKARQQAVLDEMLRIAAAR